MTQPISTGALDVADFLVHEQEDGQWALHSYATRRAGGDPVRLFADREQAGKVAGNEASKAGGTVWLSHWKTPDRIEPFK